MAATQTPKPGPEMRTRLALTALLATVGAPAVASADGTIPDRSYTASQLNTVISPSMGTEDHNQPSVVNGYLLVAGNARHAIWDISDPFAPVNVSEFASAHGDGEAESHQVAFAQRGETTYAVTINGIGVDLWDLSDAAAPELLAAVQLPGVNYGDNTEAVWGVYWQGDAIYVGGTNTGLHIVDASDPTQPTLVRTVPISEFGGVSAGPLWAVGNLLVVTTPKSHSGVATLDISDPFDPAVLDFVRPERDSYIGGFFGGNAYLIDPFRTYDVTTDPANITLLGEFTIPPSEYMSFADGLVFLGSMRPNPGVRKATLTDPGVFEMVGQVHGRTDDILGGVFTDDQFSLPVGNLVVLSDDEINIGTALAVHDVARDRTPPELLYVNPRDGATAQALTSRVGLSFSDQIDLRSVNASTVIIRPLGGDALPGMWSHNQTVVGFWPDEPLTENTTYEIVIPAGGVTDLVGNAIPSEFRSTFSTGEDVAALPCRITTNGPSLLGEAVTLTAEDAGAGTTYDWLINGISDEPLTGVSAQHTPDSPGRHIVTLTVRRDGLQRSCTAVQIVTPAPTALPPSSSSTVAVGASAPHLAWVATRHADRLSALDPADNTLRMEVMLNADPTGVVALPDGTVWASVGEADEVVILDGSTGDVLETLTLPWGSAPTGVAYDAARHLVWVVLEHDGAVVAFDPDARIEDRTIALAPDASTPPRVRGIAAAADGTLYVTRLISADNHGEVYVVGPDDSVTSLVLPIDPGPDTNLSGRGLPNYLGAPAISPDGTTLWVGAKKDNIERGLARDGEPLSTTNTVRTFVTSVDLATGEEVVGARIDLDDHNMSTHVAFSPRGDLVFVLSSGTNQVDVLDAYSGDRVAGAATGFGATGLAVYEDRLYVNDAASGTLTVLDIGGVLDGTSSVMPRLAQVAMTGEDPMTPEERLGFTLFHNADARALSQDGYVSCATCHLDGGEDGRVWDFTDRGEGWRNTIDLRGRAGTAHGPVHWTGNFDEVQDFEHDIRAHFGGTGLMDNDAFFAEGRDTPLGAAKAGVSPELDALAAYVTTFDTFPRSPYRADDGSLTDAAERGAELFRTLDCLGCHSGQSLTDSALDVRHDVGTGTVTSGERLGETLDGFDTPTLRGVWASPPYFHDGSAATLEETLRHEGHGNAQALEADEMADIVAFLAQLEGEDIDLTPIVPADPEADVGADVTGGDFAVADVSDVTGDATDTNGRVSGSNGCATSNAPAPQGAAAGLLLVALAATRRRRR